jgi:hypothetical protein
MAEGAPSATGSVIRFGTGLAGLFIVLLAVAVYAFNEHTVAKQLAEQNGAINSTLKATQDQVSSLTTRLEALNTEGPAESGLHQCVNSSPAVPGNSESCQNPDLNGMLLDNDFEQLCY